MITNKISIAGSKKDLETCFAALKPEAGENKNSRASYLISHRFGKLNITIRAKDFVAFRATTTSILNVMAIVNKTIKAGA